MIYVAWFTHADYRIGVFYINSKMFFFVYFMSKKELNYDRFVDPNILGAPRFVHLDLRMYRISFFLRCLSRQSPGFGSRSRRFQRNKIVFPHPRVKVSIVGSLRDREVACSASDRQGSNFESCVWRTVSSQSSHHPQEVLLAQFSLYAHKGGLKPDSFHFLALITHRATRCALLLRRQLYDLNM